MKAIKLLKIFSISIVFVSMHMAQAQSSQSSDSSQSSQPPCTNFDLAAQQSQSQLSSNKEAKKNNSKAAKEGSSEAAGVLSSIQSEYDAMCAALGSMNGDVVNLAAFYGRVDNDLTDMQEKNDKKAKKDNAPATGIGGNFALESYASGGTPLASCPSGMHTGETYASTPCGTTTPDTAQVNPSASGCLALVFCNK